MIFIIAGKKMKRFKSSASVFFFVLLMTASAISQEKSSQTTAILGAFSDEVALIESQLADKREQKIQGISFKTGKLNGRNVVVASSGVGKVNAAITTTLLLEHFKPAEVIFTGIAGGINAEILPADIVIAERTAQHDYGALTSEGFENRGALSPVDGQRNPVFFPADPRLLAAAERAVEQVQFEMVETESSPRKPKVIKGVIVTGDAFISSAEKKADLKKRLGADAVEMEGAAVAQVCFQQKVACLVIRSMSDLADANARRDYEKFYRLAARNSARFVTAIVGQLASSRAN
jgi:adenosylhomocysteine nucleosidase